MAAARDTSSAVLRRELADGLVVGAGCFDALSARLAELAGFRALHLSGFAFEVSQIGAPDLGLATLTELAAVAARIAATVQLPVIADVDTGFGGILNVQRTVQTMERAGVAGIHIEDQATPKRCPVLAGRRVVARSEAVDRVRATVDARTDPDFVVIARTDADVVSFDEVVERANLYLAAGADLAMPIVLDFDGRSYFAMSPDEQFALLERVARSIDGPVMGMGSPPPSGYTVKDLAEIGYSFVMFATTSLEAAATAMFEALHAITADGTDEHYRRAHPGRYRDSVELMRAVRLDDYLDVERRFGGD